MKKKRSKQKEAIFRSLPSRVLLTCLFLSLSFFVLPAYGQMANGKTKWVGNIWYNGTEPSQYSAYWNQLTPENAGKWGSVEGTRGQMNWTQLDAMYKYAKSKGYPFKQHVFVWGAQEPSWVKSLSQAEQRAEVEEWIRLYGERYPDTDYIDVVNEMFHVTPSFKDALGGNGSTGWDWIVWSFEKARQYCPKAKLLINEYNVIEGWTPVQDYVNLINILKTRGLIDGIGVQNHGLESTNLNDVKSRLTQLGNTGLPIYVSELDLDFGTDENALKNRYQALLPVLYEHPAVAGITFWGYLQGHHWRANAYLLRSDGTERPALTWIKSYLSTVATSGPTGIPTATPTATPTPGPQSAFSQIEAESFTTQSGIQTETCNEGGQDVGYIENGDYIVFNNINFGTGATGFQARVSSGTSGGNIAIRLDSSTGTLIGTCAVTGTGDWQTWATVNCNISGATGTHNLYLMFTGSSGYLFNLNWIKFVSTTPTITPTSTSTIIKGDVNGDKIVNIVDALMIAQYSVGLNPVGFIPANADVNCDGTITIVDALMVAQYYVSIITGFSC